MAAATVQLSDRAQRRGHAPARIFPRLADGATTTVYAAAYELDRIDVRVVLMSRPQTLAG